MGNNIIAGIFGTLGLVGIGSLRSLEMSTTYRVVQFLTIGFFIVAMVMIETKKKNKKS